jgi:transposase InsO family protein
MASVRRRYTAAEQARVLADVARLGVVAAARRHGVPESCVSRWNSRRAGNSSKPGVRSKVAVTARPGGKGGGRSNQVGQGQARARQVGNSMTKGVRRRAPAPAATRGGEGAAAEASRKPAASGKRVARRYTPSERAAALELASKVGVTQASKKLGISRYSLWDWKRRVDKAAQGQGDSPTAGESTEQVETQRDKEILDEWHRHPGLGPSQIRNQLRRKGVKVAVQTVRRVMEDEGYRTPKVTRSRHDKTYEAVRPNHLWHLDFLHRHVNRSGTNTLILIDDYSRFVVGHGVDENERADMVIATFERAVERHGRPEQVMHDKGSAFWSWRGISRFTALLTELGVDQIPAKHKEWNGKVEVFNLQKELFDVQRFYDVAEMKRRLEAHLSWYNQARTHHSLGGLLVPADRYYGRVEEVLARIEAGAGRDPGDLLDLRDRYLELFKVVSHGGVPEVWLLGQKLLELGTPPGPR